jgi:Domain of unknown function (DUF4340)
MRGLRSFLVMLVALVAIGGYALYEWKKVPEDSGGKKDKVFTVETDKIDEITIKSESGERTTLKKTGSDWQIVQPLTAKPDSAETSGLTTNLGSIEIQRVIDENPSDLKEYGLDPARVEVTFKIGGQERKLLIGRKTPPATDLYAKLADQKRVFLIPSFLDTTFNRTTFDLRDKAVLALNRDSIDSLSVTTPDRTLKFVKGRNEWHMTEPVATRGDFGTIDGLVSRLNTLQMKSIAAPDAAKATDYGLDRPAATVTIGSGSSQASLAIGKSSGEGAVYARDMSRPMVFTIESGVLDDMKKDVGEYRQKDLFDARPFSTTRLEIVDKGQTFAFEKSKTKNKDGQDEDKWKQVAPAPREVDPTKMQNLLSSVTQARATSFVENTVKTGLDKPELTVTVKSEEGKKEEKATFARSGNDSYAARTGELGAAKVDASTIDGIVKALEELKK